MVISQDEIWWALLDGWTLCGTGDSSLERLPAGRISPLRTTGGLVQQIETEAEAKRQATGIERCPSFLEQVESVTARRLACLNAR